MRNRWLHRPLLHVGSAQDESKRPSWLELFYDLVFVAAFIQLGNGLSSHVTLEGVAVYVGVFVPLWFIWSGFTFFLNRFAVDDFLHRLLTFAQMLAVGAMGISAPFVLEGQTSEFSVAAAVALALVSVMHLRVVLQLRGEPGSRFSKYWALTFAGAAAAWGISAVVPAGWSYGLWGISVLVVIVATSARQTQTFMNEHPLDQGHLSQRYGLLTLIVLGASFIKLLGELAPKGELGPAIYLQASVLLLMTGCLWWIYFDDVAGSQLRKGRAQWVVWLYSHLPLQMALIVVGVATKQAAAFTWQEPAPPAFRWLLAGGVSATLVAVAMIDSVTERRQAELSDRARVNMRAAGALLVLILAAAGNTMPGGMFLLMVLAIAVAQVVFDMVMAPLEAIEPSSASATPVAEMARRHREHGERPADPLLNNILRKGTPSSLRRDLYFYFIEGSWFRVLGAAAAAFVTVNVLFAALYSLEPESISDGRAASFSDAFFFSVQTFSTIGYGFMSPATPYGDMLVTIEATIGLLLSAVVTGLVFAKVSHPNASVLFSRPLLLSEMDGKPTLQFRAANARGNEVVSAEVTVTALCDTVTAEGQHMRRLVDLELVRRKTPFFVLSWTIMHVIDEASPLFGVDLSDPKEAPLGYIVTLTGHDGTYGQTIYARHRYTLEDVVMGEQFEDIISQTDDGRLMIDFDRFHATKPAG